VAEEFTGDCNNLVEIFRGIESYQTLSNIPRSHSHQVSAQDRVDGKSAILEIIRRAGLEPYMYQMGRSDQKKRMRGNRINLTSGDMDKEEQDDVMGPLDTMVMIDTDHNIPRSQFEKLLLLGHPILLYTYTPESVAGKVGNGTFTFIDDTMHTDVAGGANYGGDPGNPEKLWNWSIDYISIVKTKWFKVRHYIFRVEARKISEHRSIVLVNPHGVGKRNLQPKPLERLKLTRGIKDKFNVMKVFVDGEPFVSLGLPGHVSAYLYHADTFSAAATVFKHNSQALMQIEKEATGTKLTAPAALLALKYFEQGNTVPMLYQHGSTPLSKSQPQKQEAGNPKFQGAVPLKDDIVKAKPMGRAVSKPLDDSGVMPIITSGTVPAAMKHRLVEPKELMTDKQLNLEVMEHLIQEYATRLAEACGEKNGINPFSLEESAFKARNNKQREKILESAQHFINFYQTFLIVYGFLKAEVKKNDSKYERLIANYLKEITTAYASFLKPIEELMALLPCFGSGKTPREIAENVSKISIEAKTMLMTDLTSMDATVDDVCRKLERAVLKAFYQDPETQKAALSLLDLILKSVLKIGDYSVPLETSRGSGERGTLLFNTVIVLFCNFLSKLSYLWKGLPPGKVTKEIFTEEILSKAFQSTLNTTIACGDDGLAADLTAEEFAAGCNELNLIPKSEVVSRGSNKVNFLNRFYINPWEGFIESTRDLPRALGKYHFTTLKDDVPDYEVVCYKAMDYYYHDYNTPIIGEMAKAIHAQMRRFGITLKKEKFEEFGHWNSRAAVEPETLGYPSGYDGMQWSEYLETLVNLDSFYTWVKYVPKCIGDFQLWCVNPPALRYHESNPPRDTVDENGVNDHSVFVAEVKEKSELVKELKQKKRKRYRKNKNKGLKNKDKANNVTKKHETAKQAKAKYVKKDKSKPPPVREPQ
jgi:hypothetical protein